MSVPLAEIISRLEIAGATQIGGDPAYAKYLPVLDVDGLIPVAMIPGYSAPSIAASDVSFDDSASTLLSGVTDVQGALDTLESSVLQIGNNLSELVPVTAFGNIRQAASTTYAGVVELATNGEVEAGNDTPTSSGTINGTTTKLVPSVSSAVATFLKKSGGTMTGAITLAADPSSNLHAATKQYVDNTIDTEIAAAGLTTIPTEKVIWVSKGANATDTRTGGDKYFTSKPFATLSAAKTASASGDTIAVLPGTYVEKNLLKDGVNWFLYPGVLIQPTADTPGAIFDDSTSYGANADCVCRIYGFGRLDNTTTSAVGTGGVFHITKGGTSLTVEADTIGESSCTLPAIRIEAGQLNLKANAGVGGANGFFYSSGNAYATLDLLKVTGYEAFLIAGSSANITVNVRRNITTSYRAISVDGSGTVNFTAEEISNTANGNVVSAASTFAGTLRIDARKITTTTVQESIRLLGGKTRIENAKILNTKSSNPNNAALIVDGTSGPSTVYVMLNNCDLSCTGYYTIVSTALPVNIHLGGYVRSNTAKSSNITFKYGVYEQVTDGTIAYV